MSYVRQAQYDPELIEGSNFKWPFFIRNWKLDSPRWIFGEAGIRNLIFYLIILLLPTQLGKHFWPSFAFVSGIRVDYLSPTLYLTDVLIILLFIFSFKQKIYPHVSQKIKLTMGFLGIFLILNIWFSQSPQNSIVGIVKLSELVFFALYTKWLVSQPKKINRIAMLFSTGVIFESLLSVWQFAQSSSIGSVFYFFGERSFSSETPGIANASLNGGLILRPYGTFSHPNVLAGYLIISMMIVIFNFPTSPGLRGASKFQISNFKKALFITALLVGSIALLLSMSRVAILLWTVFITVFMVRNYFKRSKQLLVVLVIICSIGSILLRSPLRFRFFSIDSLRDALLPRTELIESSIKMISAHPLIGVGFHAFLPSLTHSSILISRVLFTPQPVHNVFLLIFAETGIIGIGIALWLLWITFRRVMSLRSAVQKGLCLSMLIAICVLSLGDHYFFTLQQGQLLLSFVLGFCWGMSSRRPKRVIYPFASKK